jgi:hypothetical protein
VTLCSRGADGGGRGADAGKLDQTIRDKQNTQKVRHNVYSV